VRDALASGPATRIAVSPIIGNEAVSGPAGRLMAASGLPVSPAGVAAAYAPWLDVLLVDDRDAHAVEEIRGLGTRAIAAPILMAGREQEVALARRVLAELGAVPAAAGA
jgi:LPPG:FO 2-phospho-L-lactate transferase